MREIEEFCDARQKAWCIHCGHVIADVAANRDHVPTKSLLSEALRVRGAKYDQRPKDLDDYLPQVLICKDCNSGFAKDESYLLCVLHAVTAGSLRPDQSRYPAAAKVLRSNRHIVRSLEATPDGQRSLFKELPPFTIYPDLERLKRIVVKNARGHVYHEISEPIMQSPTLVTVVPLMSMTVEARRNFESIGEGLDLWPEVGSRMMVQEIEGQNLAGGWFEVEPERYRYAVDWRSGVTVRTVIWDYLATEVRWSE